MKSFAQTVKTGNFSNIEEALDNVYDEQANDKDLLAFHSSISQWKHSTFEDLSFYTHGIYIFGFTSTVWLVNTHTVAVPWYKCQNLIVLQIPDLQFACDNLPIKWDMIQSSALPVALRPYNTYVSYVKSGKNININVHVTIVVADKIYIFNGPYGLPFTSNPGTLSGAQNMSLLYMGYDAVITPSLPPSPPIYVAPAVPAFYTNAYSMLRTDVTKSMIEEISSVALTVPAPNQLQISAGLSDLLISADCVIDQDIQQTASPQWANAHITNKLTVDGLIDPTGMQYSAGVLANPGNKRTVWTDGNILYYDNVTIGGNASWWDGVQTTIEQAIKSTATQTLATAGAGDLAAKIATLVDGDILEVRTNASYSPVIIPAAMRLTIRVAQGYNVILTGANCLTLSVGTRDLNLIGFVFNTCTTTDSNALGSAICMAHLGIVDRIIVANCAFYNCAESAVMLSYHQTIGGDTYGTANITPGEISHNIAFYQNSFTHATDDAVEGACIVLRGFENPLFYKNKLNMQGVGGRGIMCQNCTLCMIKENYVVNGAGTANGEGIKIDRIGAPTYYNSGYVIENKVKNCVQGIDIDDFDNCTAIGNVTWGNTNEGLCLCGVGTTMVFSNVSYNNNDGIALEIGVTAYNLKNNVSFNNTTNNYRLDMGGAPDASNTTAMIDCSLGDDSVPYNNATSALTAKNVQAAIDELRGYFPVPAASTDEAIARYDGANGKLQNSGILIDNTDNMTLINSSSLKAIALNPGGVNTIWNFTGNYPRFGADALTVGPTVTVDNTIPRFDLTNGKLQTSGCSINDSNTLTAPLGYRMTTTGANYDVLSWTDNVGFASYIGITGGHNNGLLFARAAAGGISLSSSQNIIFHIDSSTDSDLYYFQLYRTANDFTPGTSLLKISGNGRIITGGDAATEYYTSLKDEDNMASNDAHSICTQQSIKAYVDSFYSSGTFDATWTGIWAVDPASVTCKYRRSGNIVTVYHPQLLAAASIVGQISTTAAVIPAALRPATACISPIATSDNSTYAWGSVAIGTNGILFAYPPSQSFTGTGSSGITLCNFTYSLA